MNFLKFIFITLFTVTAVYGQNVLVDYKFLIIDNKDQYGITGCSVIRLITNKNESISYGKNIDTIIVNNSGVESHMQEATEFVPTSFKEFIIGKRYSRTMFPRYNLKDENYSIEWNLIDDTKKILGYNCNKAVGNYRGREYEAYYTTEIPIQNGPNTFDNLPGLVLEVYSTDGVVSFKAFEVKNTDEKIYNVFDDDKNQYISWEEFVNAYKDYFKRITNFAPDEDTTIIIPKRGIEVYINDNE